MSIKAILISILICATAAVITDLVKYANALGTYSDRPDDITVTKPRFIWQLFLARLAVGAITGLQVGLGFTNINSVANGTTTQPIGGF